MADSIVERLREWDDGIISTHYKGCWDSHPVCAILLAADAIEELTAERDAQETIISDLTVAVDRLRAEVERLRAAGNALAEARSRQVVVTPDPLLDAWNEARRG